MGRDRSDTQSDGAPSLVLHPAVFHPNCRSFTAQDSVCVCLCVFRAVRAQVYRRYRWDPARRACTGIAQSAGHSGPHGNTGTAGSSRGQSGPQDTLEVKTERK